ncbi:hypothetical protein AJ78_01124 [Emergomyces pasteurianus Ep9510]|uniref:DUF3984 domain-containing protein n=1 Tax=Emergomyces pasteurianus Ep9510 TaxID=1447872 RepID=A0A1J9QUD1_9EURO|nr:hypothetical protein AJ78_01124 [Emergomyces pasteurianus Ep9510]
MESLAHSNIPNSFRSRRSHTSLHHISLAPLTSRFPVDDDDGPDSDYFYSNQDDSGPSRRFAYSPHPATMSYLASVSVPTTPPILSRNPSYSSLSKKKTSPSLSQMSDTKLDKMGSEQARHHRRAKSYISQRPKLYNTAKRQDSEWLLRAGSLLSSATREEKGQSWLVKRASSTSLAAEEIPDNERRRNSHHSRHTHSRRPRSGLSTPTILSRRPSSSHPASKFCSGADLSMTAAHLAGQSLESRASIPDDTVGLVPDFVDENLRNEMSAMYPSPIGQATTPRERGVRGFDDSLYPTLSRRNSALDSSFSASTSELSDSEIDEEEVDEAEMQRLTRERGLGLGRWIDRLVEWTLFNVEEEIPFVNVEPPRQARQLGDIQHQTHADKLRNASNPDQEPSETESENDQGTDEDENSTVLPIENPGDKGGWSDLGWFLRVVKSLVI